jgi:hypothetical protein
LLRGPALADDYSASARPTGNIHCAMYTFNGRAEARCDLREYTPSYTKRPAGCEFDWGMAFAVGASGKGYLACVSDAVQDPGNPVLPYGEAVSGWGHLLRLGQDRDDLHQCRRSRVQRGEGEAETVLTRGPAPVEDASGGDISASMNLPNRVWRVLLVGQGS